MFKNHPKGLLAAALTNMGERFGFYIMMAILTLFISSKFGLSETTTGFIYSAFYALYIFWHLWEVLLQTKPATTNEQLCGA